MLENSTTGQVLHCSTFSSDLLVTQRQAYKTMARWVYKGQTYNERESRVINLARFLKHCLKHHLQDNPVHWQRKEAMRLFLHHMRYWGAPHDHVPAQDECLGLEIS